MLQTRVQAAPFDPEDLAGLRARVDAATGGGYARFRNGLAPDYRRVRRDIAGGYAALGEIMLPLMYGRVRSMTLCRQLPSRCEGSLKSSSLLKL